jgi:thiol:disulfide interchange protein DsbA
MVRRLTLFCGLMMSLLATSFVANAVEFTKDDYYIEIKGQLSKKQEIVEYFSFFCPHCFKQEPLMKALAGKLPSHVAFKKNHVDGMPGQTVAIEQALSKALITAEVLHVKDKMVAAIFNYIHVNRAKFDSIKDIKNVFLINGVEGKAFDKTFASFSTNTQFNKRQRNTAELRKQGITAVPTLIINGKYKPVTDKVKSMDEYVDLILFLLNKDF